ncbi:MAG TPA: LOG family protein, partial [Gemmataceae bacterium]|nr:LOG family protein [Gemmataceae bacterium]
MKPNATSGGTGFFEHVNEAVQPDGHHPPGVEELVQQLKETADKLIRDHANRGDVKLLSTALKELRYAFKIFAAYRNRRKVTVFGSARLAATHPACEQAVAFSRRMAAAGYMVITGAASGIMEAGHVGAGRENSIGVNILLPFEQSANAVIAGDVKLMHLKYFFTRKLLFVKECDAVALFPGGFGTQDEGFEVLTLVQTGKSHLFPIVMIDEPGGGYWRLWLEFIQKALLDRGMISPEDLSLFKVTDSVEEAVEEVLGFYRVYHSMRYVRGELVLRLNHALPEALLGRIRRDFSDIVVAGTFEQSGALPEEAGEANLASLPRLHFRFDRRSLGRLRQLIDLINREG